MVFSSSEFVFFFLPVVLLVYFALLRKRGHRNVFLTLISLFFYGWGEPWFMFVMLASIAFNWLCALQIDRRRETRGAKAWLTFSIIGNLSLLGTFKYLVFALKSINAGFGAHIPVPEIVCPLAFHSSHSRRCPM